MNRKWLVALLGLLTSQLGQAVTIDLRSAGGNGGGFNNSLQFSQQNIVVDVFGFGATGLGSLFRGAEVWSGVRGVGVCNRDEGSIRGGSCNDSEHEVDTVNSDDLVVFYFDQTVQFDSITVDPYNGPGDDPDDRDIVYWVGQSSSLPDFRQQTFDTLDDITGFSGETFSGASASLQFYKHALSGVGNIFVLSGDYHDDTCQNTSGSQACEAYKLASISVTPVPAPAAGWLLGSAILAMMTMFRRRPCLLAGKISP